MIDPTSSDFLVFIVTLIGSGAIAGVLAGLFGIGGGAVLVPVLFQFQSLVGVDEAVRMHMAVGTSLGVIVPTSLRSVFAHYKRGAVDMELLRSLAGPVVIGVILGSLVAAWVPADGLKGIFSGIAFLVALKLLFGRKEWRLGAELPGPVGRGAIGVIIGFLSVLMGIGGGVMNNTFMTLYGRPLRQAVATSAGVGVLISIPGMLGFVWAGWGAADLPPLSLGFVNLLAVAMIIPLTLLCAPLGVRLAHVLPPRMLEVSFGLFMMIVAVRFAIGLL